MTNFEKIAAGLIRNLVAEPALGLSKLDAAAIVGNFARETGDFKYCTELSPVVKGSRGGINLAQWTGPRRVDFEAYAKRNGLDFCDWATGYKFFFVEVTTTWEKRVIPALKAAPTLDRKVEVFESLYERAGVVALEDRKARALRALHAYEKYPYADPIVPLPLVGYPDPQPAPVAPEGPIPTDDPYEGFPTEPEPAGPSLLDSIKTDIITNYGWVAIGIAAAVVLAFILG